MNRSHASAAVLGTSAALAAAFLAQPDHARAATRRTNAIAIPAHVAHARAAMTTLAQQTKRDPSFTGTRGVAVAVCHECAASRTLVRVLIRRRRYGMRIPPLRLYTDRTWPALDTLARHTHSTVVVIRQLDSRVGITPAAVGVDRSAAALGVTDVLALIDSHSKPDNSHLEHSPFGNVPNGNVPNGNAHHDNGARQ